MYSLPNQISLDPSVCLVRNNVFTLTNKTARVLPEASYFRVIDNGTSDKINAAYPLNIYLNFQFIVSSLKNNQNDKGDVNLYGFISALCVGLNKALGGINNLEPIIDKTSNTLKIIDSTPIPGITAPEDDSYKLMLYGYKGSNYNENYQSYTTYESNFIRNIDLKTTITPEYATMVTVGATANGYVKGTEATAFSVWNKGIIDRFKYDLISPSPNTTQTTTSGSNEAETNYINEYLAKRTECYGFNGNLYGTLGDIDSDIVGKNISIVTEFYKYLIAKNSQKTIQAGTIGFIPFKLGITMDGISGIKIYNKLNVNSEFLPTRYGETLNFIITGVNHRLQNNDWETNLDTIVIPKTSTIDSLGIDFNTLIESAGGCSLQFPAEVSDKRVTLREAKSQAKNLFPTLSNRAIGALLGHLQAESQFNPTARNEEGGGCGAFGIAQWRGSRLKNLFNFAKSKGKPVDDFATQLEFVKKELSTGGNYFNKVWEILNSPQNLSLIQLGSAIHLTYGLSPSSDPKSNLRDQFNYNYKFINDLNTWKTVYLRLKGKNPNYIPDRYRYMQTAESFDTSNTN
jgi:hypothetical protein